MKKLISLITVVLLLTSFAACSFINREPYDSESDPVPGWDNSVSENDPESVDPVEGDPVPGWDNSVDVDYGQVNIPLSVSEGDIITFGSYNGKPIDWIVLTVGKGRVLLISREVLTDRLYDERNASDGTWENCSLRSWLNNEFFNSAFSSSEQAVIPEVWIQAEKNAKTGADSGNDTFDRVFLLSLSELERYMPTERERQCEESAGSWYWCLRTAGSYLHWVEGNLDQAAPVCVYYDGTINYEGQDAAESYGIRPAIWIEPWG